MKTLDTFLFGLYPYICLSVFLLGSLIRFDRDQYTWKSDSSQLLKAGQSLLLGGFQQDEDHDGGRGQQVSPQEEQVAAAE